MCLARTVKRPGYEKLVALRYWNEAYVPYEEYERTRKTGKVKGSRSWVPDYF